MSDNAPEEVVSDLGVLTDQLGIDLAFAEHEADAFQTASEDSVEDYVERLREIARAGEQALARGDA